MAVWIIGVHHPRDIWGNPQCKIQWVEWIQEECHREVTSHQSLEVMTLEVTTPEVMTPEHTIPGPLKIPVVWILVMQDVVTLGVVTQEVVTQGAMTRVPSVGVHQLLVI